MGKGEFDLNGVVVEPMHVKLGMKKGELDKALKESLNHERPSIKSRVLTERVGFKELCPMCSSDDWAEREAETYDDLRDAHLEVINENLDLKKQLEKLEKEVKRLQRKLNDIRCNLDD